MNPMQAMPQQAPMGGQPPMGPMGGPQMGGRPPMGGAQGGFSMPARGVNLFKIQEQLKDMPQQAVMAYANGQNPDLVPPYIALGEMERRTRAAKNAQPSQSPQGTVKDNLEQQIKQAAGLASLAGQKQQQAQQQQMSQSLQAPGPVPEDVPSPEAQAEPPVMMAGGGLATLPMNPRMTNYRDGGIVGYAEGEVVETPYIGYRSPRRQEQPENPDVDENGNPRGRDERAAILAKNAVIAQQKAELEKASAREQQFKPVPGKEAMEQFYKPRRPTQGPTVTTAAPQAAPAAPQAAPAAEPVNPPFDPSKPAVGKYDLSPGRMEGTLAAIQRIADPQERERAMQAFTSQSGLAALPAAVPQGEDRLQQADARNEDFLKRMRVPVPLRPEQQAAINMPVEQDYMKRLRELAAQRGEEDVRSRADIEERKKMDFTRALLAGAEASRGYKGLGSLSAGFARSSLGSREARMNEEAALRASGLSRAELLEKAQFEMNTLQRAIAVGDRERAEKSKLELDKLEEQLRGKTTMGAASVTGAAIGADTRAAVAAAKGEQAGDVAKDRAIKMAEDEYARDPTVQRLNKLLESPIFALGTTPAIKTQRESYEKQLSDIRKAKYQQHGITMTESTTASPLDLSKWGKPTKQ